MSSFTADQYVGGQFVWFTGVVESRQDPEQMGRVRVRCFGFHTDSKSMIPTEDLPWATVVLPATSSGTSGVGAGHHGLVPGSWVVGFFRDGPSAQDPIVIGSIQGFPTEKGDSSKGFTDPTGVYPRYTNEPDVNKRARGINTTPKTPVSLTGEPADPFAAKYPFNHIIETESGHIIEYDDTTGAERINIQHRTGSFIEFHPNGDLRVRSTDRFDASKNMNIYVENNAKVVIAGNANITVNGNTNINSQKEMRVFCAEDILMKGSNIHLNPLFGFADPKFQDEAVSYPQNANELSVEQQKALVTEEPAAPLNPEVAPQPKVEETPPKTIPPEGCTNPWDIATKALSLGKTAWNETPTHPNIKAVWDELGFNGEAQTRSGTAWCAAFTGAVLKRAGAKYKKTAASQDYANYGQEVPGSSIQQQIQNAKRGDILVFYRLGRSSGKGHVGIYNGQFTDTKIGCLGGNQSNSLTVNWFKWQNTDQWGLRTIRRAICAADGQVVPDATVASISPGGTGGSVT
jgi:uncharacterized protein (TIGR02594 family)